MKSGREQKTLPYLFKVVDLPEEGLPTRPIRGSRGISRHGISRYRGSLMVLRHCATTAMSPFVRRLTLARNNVANRDVGAQAFVGA